MAFHDSVSSSNPFRGQLDADKLLKDLVVELRRSLDLPFSEELDFDFHLVGTHLQE